MYEDWFARLRSEGISIHDLQAREIQKEAEEHCRMERLALEYGVLDDRPRQAGNRNLEESIAGLRYIGSPHAYHAESPALGCSVHDSGWWLPS